MSSQGWSDPGYEALVELIGARTGLAFTQNRRSFAEAGIRRAMAKAGVARTGDYLDGLRSTRLSLDDLIVELTVGETYFFRDPAQLDYLRETIVPEIRRRRGTDHVLRVWSAGCATGEEPYSLAILLEEAGLGDRSRILATDISRTALTRAQAAAYGSWSFRGGQHALASHYFHPAGKRFKLNNRLRSRVRFEYLNLALDNYPSLVSGTADLDVILCRNVLIYFDRDTTRRIAGCLFNALSEGGWLITGASDPLLSDHAPFDAVSTPAGLAYRRGTGTPVSLRVLPSSTCGVPLSDAAAAQKAGIELPPPATRDRATEASNALLRGDYGDVLKLTEACASDPTATALRIRALANSGDRANAERTAARSVVTHPLSSELQFLHGILLIELGRLQDAADALRRVIYLDGGLAIAHLTLGSVLRRLGDRAEARRAYRNGHMIAAGQPAETTLPLSDGETAGRLAASAKAQLAMLEAGDAA